MNVASTSSQFQYLSLRRLKEADVLLAARHWSGALYLAGYVAECSFKALIARRHGDRLPGDFFTHDLTRLRAEVLEYIRENDVPVIQAVPAWTVDLRYVCAQPQPRSVVAFFDRAKEAYRCLSTYL